MSRILGIDLGERRIGLAVAESGIGGARPLATIGRAKTIDGDADALARVCREQVVVELVVGLPIEAAGQEGTMAEGARAWATEIGTRLAMPGHDARRAAVLVRGRAAPRPDAARSVGWRAVARPAQRLSRPDRSRGRRRHPPGRAGRAPGGSVSIRSGQGPRQPIDPQPQTPVRRADPYRRTGRYGRGPGDQRRYERYGDRRGGIGGIVRFLLFLVVIAAAGAGGHGDRRPAAPARRRRAVGVGQPRRAPARLRVGPRSRGPRRRPDRPRLGGRRPVEFVVQPGDTPTSLAPRLEDAGIIASQRAFLYEARQETCCRSSTPAGSRSP